MMDQGVGATGATRMIGATSFETKPTIYEDMVIAPANGRVYAFNADSTSEEEGRLLWANPRVGQDPQDWRFIEAGTAHRDAFYIGNGQADSDGTLLGFHTNTGGRNGKARLRGTQMPYCQEDEDCESDDLEPLRTAVVRNGPDIYFGNDAGELIQYTSDTISWVFTTASKRNVRGDIAATEEIVVFSDRSGAIYAVNPDREEATKRTSGTGKKPERLWVESTEERRWIAGGPVISGDYVYVIDSHGLLYMIDLERVVIPDTRWISGRVMIRVCLADQPQPSKTTCSLSARKRALSWVFNCRFTLIKAKTGRAGNRV